MYFWSKIENRINHRFAKYTTCKKIMQINLKYMHVKDFKHNDWHCRLSFFFTLALVERRNPSNSNYIRDVINYLKKGFPLERGICLQYRGICLGKYPGTVGKCPARGEIPTLHSLWRHGCNSNYSGFFFQPTLK